jgi:DNA polymerase III epsilon subunit-like protein
VKAVVLDFETTGSVRGWPNEPWQLGWIVVENGRPLAETAREVLFNIPTDRPFSPRAPGRWTELRDELAAAPAFQDLWPDLAPILIGMPLVAHNAATERTILEKRAPLSPFGPWRDTLKLVRRLWPGLPSYALGDLIATFGLTARVDALCDGRTWHDALYDACAGAILYGFILEQTGAYADPSRLF